MQVMADERDSQAQRVPVDQLTTVLVQMGCSAEKADEMAGQLIRRAGQLAETTGRSETEAMQHLLGLMRQGWAAKARGFSNES
ncbi:MAG: hypothetical protein M2R45_00476 [Verrucomicrobia subdivision 3 bacterium]|nr:hypothetical protein [Limisphaerales bacterium]MCS1413645.1 hypothetical protein [Limisphaerales bacterium]